MNISDIFYLVAIIFMVVNTAILILIGVFIFKFFRRIQSFQNEILGRIANFQIAKYSLQFSLLKNALNIFKKFTRSGGDRE